LYLNQEKQQIRCCWIKTISDYLIFNTVITMSQNLISATLPEAKAAEINQKLNEVKE